VRALPDARVLRDLSDGGRVSAGAIDVVAGLIRDGAGRYLITRRRAGTHLAGLWEFPGGKREPDETLEQSLARELAEELGAVFAVGDRIETVRWAYPEKTVALHFFRCEVTAGTIAPREGQMMEWVAPSELRRYAFPAADEALLARLEAAG
jgi:mutator protein MutT